MIGDGDESGSGGGSGGGPLAPLLAAIGRLGCLFGWHDYAVISRSFGFGPSGDVEKVECRRCGHVTARKG